MKILAVDDDPVALNILGECLAQAGHTHVTLETSARRAFEQLRDTSIPYDCVLLDIDMPERDGIELCGDIRRLDRYRNAPILMITKHMEQAVVERAFAAGATDYVTKPFTYVEVITRIRVAHSLVQERRAALDSYLALQNSIGQPAVGRATARKSKDVPPVELEEAQHVSGDNLLPLTVFRNYLEQAAREEKAKIHLTAIKAQYISRIFELTSSDEFLEFLKMFSQSISEEFKPEAVFMTHMGNGVFLCSSHLAPTQSLAKMEEALLHKLRKLVDKSGFVQDVPVDLVMGSSLKINPTPKLNFCRASKAAIARMDSRDLEHSAAVNAA
ncbi:response regulator [Roseovarius sp. C7]|uniref:response regulator n=1 Tax=Roseovarius sp. C7 TaxID=3398643 RepID=UPI0039F6FCD3